MRHIRPSRRRLLLPLLVGATGFALAACGTSGAAEPSSASPHGVVTFAEQVGAAPNYIFPFTASQYFTVDNTSQFQFLMYRPLYFFGVAGRPVINAELSLAALPVYSNNDTTVTITLKHYMWSDGEPVTSRDVIFWMNLLKANKANWAAYVPGAFPDNVASYSAPNASTVVFHLTGKVNPTWFTYNELSQITPLPIAWDRTSLSQPAPSPSAANLPDTTTSGAKAVYTFLNSQATNANAWASSPIWSVVDGPWKLKSSSTTGRMVFVPNPSYTGPVKPSLSEFVELPFTSDTAEFNTLRAGNGAITYGYVPSTALSQLGVVRSIGYRIEPWVEFGFNYFVENFNNPTYGPLFKQTYFRQAFQHLVDQPQWISTFLKGYGVPSYSPVPLAPANPYADAASRHNLYPYSISAAKSLLTSHGWTMVNGVMTCERPGTAATDCGAGIAKGFTLTLSLQYASGTTSITQEMDALQSAAASAGIKINLSQAPFNTVFANAAPCSGSSCTWQIENWGAGWEYSPDDYPTGGELYTTGAGSNVEGWNDPTTNRLIAATHTSSNPQAALDAYQNYMARVLPVVYQPLADYQVSAIANDLHGVSQNAFLNLTPEAWRLG